MYPVVLPPRGEKYLDIQMYCRYKNFLIFKNKWIFLNCSESLTTTRERALLCVFIKWAFLPYKRFVGPSLVNGIRRAMRNTQKRSNLVDFSLTGAWGTHSFSYGCSRHPQNLYWKPYYFILKYAILKFLRVLGAPIGLVISYIRWWLLGWLD